MSAPQIRVKMVERVSMESTLTVARVKLVFLELIVRVVSFIKEPNKLVAGVFYLC